MINVLLYVLIFLILLICVSAILTQITTLKIRRSIPKFGKTTELHKAEIHWYEAGAGKPIIMLHGLAGNLRNFTYALTDKLNQDYRVIAIDRAGDEVCINSFYRFSILAGISHTLSEINH